MKLYRVFPYDAGAAPNDRGGALFVPPASGRSRIDNRDLYDVLYAASEPTAAVAETFGRFAVWRAETFVNAGGRPYALATLAVPDDLVIFELNDIEAMRSIGILRPTDIITRDREITQAWARRIFERGGFAGVRWWSFYDPGWPVVGLWSHERIVLDRSPDVLTVSTPVVLEAAATIVRQIAP